uniref:Uncharacterized protein n=1 Tax=Panagrolaimus sp. ES5 TaxID=591445 RepID=A0AC34GTB1_9BILA
MHKGVYGAGLSKSGALGIRYLVEKRTAPETVLRPLRISFCNSKKITKIAAGCGFSIFANNHELYGSGLNNFYQLGGAVNDKKVDRSEQYYIGGKKITLPSDSGKILDIAAGRLHCLISTENKIYAFGNNSHGQCGQDPEKHQFVTHNRANDELVNIFLPDNVKVKKVHCTLDTSFLLLTDGRLLSFGLGEDGQTGNGIKGKNSWIPQEVGGDIKGERIVRIGGSADTLLAANENGDLFAWGLNEYGQLQMVTDEVQVDYPRHLAVKLGSIVSVGATGSSCIISNSDGLVYTWGAQILGFGPEVSSVPRPMLLDPPLFGSVVNEDGNVSRVFSGCYSMGALTTGGNLFLWGVNRFGSLGLGHSDDQFFPFQVFLPEQVRNASLGPDHSLFVTT